MTVFELCLAAMLLAMLGWTAIAGYTLVDRLRFEREIIRLAQAGRVRRATLNRVLLDPAQPVPLKGRAAQILLRSRGRRRLARDADGQGAFCTRWQRLAAWHALYLTGSTELHGPLRRAMADTDSTVTAAAVAMLGTLGDRAAVDILIAALRPRRAVSQSILMQIDRCNHADVVAAMQPLLGDGEGRMRACAIALLGRHPVPGMDRRLGGLAGDADPAVRKAVAQAMGELSSPYCLVVAARLLHDADTYVRAHAVRALHRIAMVHPVRLRPLLAQVHADKDWWVRLAVREASAMASGAMRDEALCSREAPTLLEPGQGRIAGQGGGGRDYIS